MKRKLPIFGVFCFVAGLVTMNTQAMHIMEGFLPVGWSIGWGILCLPFFIAGIISMKKTLQEDSKTKLVLAMAGAFAFVLSALKVPSVTGSCSHATGVGLGAILFGPTVMVVIGGIVLLFQALLLAHGGITTLGANVFSMAIVGPFAAYFIYKLLRKTKMPEWFAIFLAAYVRRSSYICYDIYSARPRLSNPNWRLYGITS